MGLENKKRSNINSILKKNLEHLKKGDFSVLTDDEVQEILVFIRSFVLKYRQFRDESDDIVNEVFLHIMKNKFFYMDDSYDNLTTYLGIIVKSYLNGILIHRSYDVRSANYNKDSLDKKAYNDSDSLSTELDLVESLTKTPYEELILSKEKSDIKILTEIIESNEILKLHYLDNLTYREIGEILNMSRQAANMRIIKGLAELKIKLAEMGRNNIFNPKTDGSYLSKYLEKRIGEYGVSAVIISEDVDMETVAKLLNVETTFINSKFLEDKRLLLTRIKECGIVSINSVGKYAIRDAYMYILASRLKEIELLSDEVFLYVEDQIKNSKYVFDKLDLECKTVKKELEYQKLLNYHKITKEDFEQKVEEELFDIKCNVEKYLKTYSHRRSNSTLPIMKHIEKKKAEKNTSRVNIPAIDQVNMDFSGYSSEHMPTIMRVLRNNELVADFLDKNMTTVQYAESLNMSSATIRSRLERIISLAKVELAEKGIFDKNYSQDLDPEYVKEIRDNIVKYGVTSTSVVKDISSFEMSQILNIKDKFVNSKIYNDIRDLYYLLKDYKVVSTTTPKGFANIMLKTFPMSKYDVMKLPESTFKQAKEELVNNEFLNQFWSVVPSSIYDKYTSQGYSKQDVNNMINNEVMLVRQKLASNDRTTQECTK